MAREIECSLQNSPMERAGFVSMRRGLRARGEGCQTGFDRCLRCQPEPVNAPPLSHQLQPLRVSGSRSSLQDRRGFCTSSIVNATDWISPLECPENPVNARGSLRSPSVPPAGLGWCGARPRVSWTSEAMAATASPLRTSARPFRAPRGLKGEEAGGRRPAGRSDDRDDEALSHGGSGGAVHARRVGARRGAGPTGDSRSRPTCARWCSEWCRGRGRGWCGGMRSTS